MEVKSPLPCPNTVTVRRNPHRKARPTPFINPTQNSDHESSSSSAMPQISSFPLQEILSMEMSRHPKEEDSFSVSSVTQPPISENLQVYLRIRPLSISKGLGQSDSLGDQNRKLKLKNAWPQNPVKKQTGREKNTKKKNDEVCLSVNDSMSVTLSPSVALQESKRIKSEVYEGFSHVFTAESSQNEVFEKMVSPLVEDFLKGKNGMVAALGPSGSGKTHTIFGSVRDPGIVPLIFQYIFKQAKSKDLDSTRQLSFSLSIFEIYSERSKGEKIYDLLADGAEVNMQQSSIKGLKEVTINAPKEAESIVACAMLKRNTASTNANSTSSRSQCIINIRCLAGKLDDGGFPLSFNEAGVVLKVVDLAGAEREKRTGNQGTRLLEANFINNTSMVFGLCLRSLYEYQKNPKKPLQKHFHNSLLTKYLRDYLEGKKRMTLILTVKPGAEDYVDTSYVLRQAAPFMKIKFQTVVDSSNLSCNKRQLQTLFMVEQPKRMKLSGLEACAIEGRPIQDENFLHQEVAAEGSKHPSLKLGCPGSEDKERSHLIMQHFAKTIWNVLKEYRDKLKNSEGEVQSLHEKLVTQTKRSAELEEQLKSLKCCCTCSNESHLETLTAVDESFTSRLDINVDISPKLECPSTSKCSSLSKQDFKLLSQKSKDILDIDFVKADCEEYTLESISGNERDTHCESKHLEAERTASSSMIIIGDERSSLANLDSHLGNEIKGLKEFPVPSGVGATFIKPCENVEIKNDDPGTTISDQPTACNYYRSDSNALVADEVVDKQLEVLDVPPVRNDGASTEDHREADLPVVARRVEKPKRRLLPASSALLRDFNTLHIDEEAGKLKGNKGAKKEDKDERFRTQGSISLLRMLKTNLLL